jgi:D-alanine-D-alanine ligase
MNTPIYVLYGGTSAEREVSLRSAEGVVRALYKAGHQPIGIDLQKDSIEDLPAPDSGVIFPVLHGTFGEDGQLQQLLENGGYEYVGCDATSSRICFDKELALLAAESIGAPVAKRLVYSQVSELDVSEIEREIGFPAVLKPACQGSSVGLHVLRSKDDLLRALPRVPSGKLLIEEQIQGREFSVGVLDGQALGIVEIKPKGGVYDYKHKYTDGFTEYLFPAPLSDDMTMEIRKWAERIYNACGCRDFARVDFLQHSNGRPVFLEVNTIPGMTATSLLPKSASVLGMDYVQLVEKMICPALQRFKNRLWI